MHWRWIHCFFRLRMPSRTTSSLIRHLITSVFNLPFTRRKRGLPSRCAFVFLYEVALSTEEEEEEEKMLSYPGHRMVGLRQVGIRPSINPCFPHRHGSSCQTSNRDKLPVVSYCGLFFVFRTLYISACMTDTLQKFVTLEQIGPRVASHNHSVTCITD